MDSGREEDVDPEVSVPCRGGTRDFTGLGVVMVSSIKSGNPPR